MQETKEVKRWQVAVVKLNRFLSTPLGLLTAFGLMLALIVVFFTVRSAGTQQKAVDIANNTHNTVENTRRILDELKANQERTERKVDQSTLILCRLILRSDNIDLTAEEEAEVEKTCQDEIRKQTEETQTEQPLAVVQDQPGTISVPQEQPDFLGEEPPAQPDPSAPSTPSVPVPQTVTDLLGDLLQDAVFDPLQRVRQIIGIGG